MIRKKDDRRIRSIKKAAACALAFAFLLSACGMAKSGSARDTDSGAYSAYADSEEYDYDEAMVTEDPYPASYNTYDSYSKGSEDYAVSEAIAEAEMSVPLATEGTASAVAEGSSTDTVDSQDATDLKSSNRKIVYTGNVSLQTLEYDKSAQSIHEKITACGGFIESENTYNEDPYWYYSERSGASANRTRRKLNITARIPADQFDAFMKNLEEDGQVTNTSVSARNISVSYATHDASRKALEIERDRLLNMMDKAETIEEMIAVEERLTYVERELGDEMTTLSAMDRDVNFSTVIINLQEVFEYSEKVVEVTYGERLQRAFGRAIDGFVTFWENLILFVVETFPFLIMLAVVLFVVIRLLRRRRARKMAEKYAAIEAARAMAGTAGAPSAYSGAYPGNYAAGTEDRKKGFFHRRKKAEMSTPPSPTPAAPPAAGESGAYTPPTGGGNSPYTPPAGGGSGTYTPPTGGGSSPYTPPAGGESGAYTPPAGDEKDPE